MSLLNNYLTIREGGDVENEARWDWDTDERKEHEVLCILEQKFLKWKLSYILTS